MLCTTGCSSCPPWAQNLLSNIRFCLLSLVYVQCLCRNNFNFTLNIFNDISKTYAQMLLLGGAEPLHTIFTQIKCWIDSSMYLPCRVNRLNGTTSAVSSIKYNHSWTFLDWPLWRLRFSEGGAHMKCVGVQNIVLLFLTLTPGILWHLYESGLSNKNVFTNFDIIQLIPQDLRLNITLVSVFSPK